jgi:peptide/nickel transport system permease protein
VSGAGPARRAWRRFRRRPLGLVGLGVLVVIALAAWIGPVLSPYGFDEIPAEIVVTGPSAAHPFGTNDLGQDELTRVLVGGRASLTVGLVVALVATALGAAVGVVAGYAGGVTDSALSRLVDVFLAAPALVVLLALSLAVDDVGVIQIALIIALLSWMGMARIVRASTRSLREREYVLAARAAGAGRLRVMTRHILPACAGEIIVFATLLVGVAILAEATLSFLGFGLDPTTDPSWGSLLQSERQNVLTGEFWWLTVFPGLFIVLTVLAVNLVGDALRDALDPTGRSRRARA